MSTVAGMLLVRLCLLPSTLPSSSVCDVELSPAQLPCHCCLWIPVYSRDLFMKYVLFLVVCVQNLWNLSKYALKCVAYMAYMCSCAHATCAVYTWDVRKNAKTVEQAFISRENAQNCLKCDCTWKHATVCKSSQKKNDKTKHRNYLTNAHNGFKVQFHAR